MFTMIATIFARQLRQPARSSEQNRYKREERGGAAMSSIYKFVFFFLNITNSQSMMVVYNWSPPSNIAYNKTQSEIGLSKFSYALSINKIDNLFNCQVKFSSYSC
ncbi:hypothetical protein VIGAN_02014300 [Vigna angularis var. angularis]|uniref:Uncharacterized protein n=1 Tax=Vigna angularis var. angularis TaxID=157739 RepID=A0A0S3RAG1_PHAAN|nr:hypothetical protein VIGAN_02014300 [Vigna angularis var. angularis]